MVFSKQLPEKPLKSVAANGFSSFSRGDDAKPPRAWRVGFPFNPDGKKKGATVMAHAFSPYRLKIVGPAQTLLSGEAHAQAPSARRIRLRR